MELQLTDVLPFGKFKGYPIDFLIKGKTKNEQSLDLNKIPCDFQQLDYLSWWNKEVKTHTLSKEIFDLLSKSITKRQTEISTMQFEAKNRQNDYDRKYPDKSRKSSYNRVNQDRWEAGGMNTDYQEAGMSLGDMGYEGDGW